MSKGRVSFEDVFDSLAEKEKPQEKRGEGKQVNPPREKEKQKGPERQPADEKKKEQEPEKKESRKSEDKEPKENKPRSERREEGHFPDKPKGEGNIPAEKMRVASEEEVEELLRKSPEAYIIYRVMEEEEESDEEERSVGAPADRIVRLDTGEVIEIDGIVRIGKDRSYTTYLIEGNTTISRRHAELKIKDGDLYIKDKGSTNGTFLDGVRLKPEVPVKVKKGQIIMLSNVKFEAR